MYAQKFPKLEPILRSRPRETVRSLENALNQDGKRCVWLLPWLFVAVWVILEQFLHFSRPQFILKSLCCPEVSSRVPSHSEFLLCGTLWIHSNPHGALEIQNNMGPFWVLGENAAKSPRCSLLKSVQAMTWGQDFMTLLLEASLWHFLSSTGSCVPIHPDSWLELLLKWPSVIILEPLSPGTAKVFNSTSFLHFSLHIPLSE